MKPVFRFEDAVFTYAIASRPLDCFEAHAEVAGGKLVVSHTAKTEVRSAVNAGREVVIIGFCVDAHGEVGHEQIPAFAASQTFADLTAAYRFFDRFAGKYIVLYRNGNQMAVWGDATCSLEINYDLRDSAFCAASLDRITADFFGEAISPYSRKIRNGADYGQPMPNDLTMYERVKALLPNHYLELDSGRAVRVKLQVRQDSTGAELDRILSQTAEWTDRISRAYEEAYKIYVPMTAGTDSRTVYSFLKNSPCYTFWHEGFTEKTPDLWIPAKICGEDQREYTVINDASVSEEYKSGVSAMTSGYEAPSTFQLVYTLSTRFPGAAIVEGAIIDEIGKSTQVNALPVLLATPSFFLCKLHNYESLAKNEIRTYLREITEAGERSNVFDLFEMELKCGRRVGKEATLFGLCGISSLNIFNCRDLILQWMRIPRELRAQKVIHHAFLERNERKLLEFPFNPGSPVSVFKRNPVLFYLGTYVKYYLKKPKRISGTDESKDLL